MQFQGALIREQGVTFGILLVQEHVMDSRTQQDEALTWATSFFGAPAVLMSDRRYRTCGRRDIVAFLSNCRSVANPVAAIYGGWLMALYKDVSHMHASTSDAFDAVYSPGTSTPYSGIYRCTGCGKENVSEHGKSLPPQNHHVHAVSAPPIRWRLQVFAQHDGS